MPRFPIAPLRNLSRGLMTEETFRLRQMWDESEEGYPRALEQYDTLPTVSYGEVLSANERTNANQMGYQVDAKRCLPVGTDVLPGDRLQVGERVYDISAVLDDTTEDLMPHLEVWVRRVDTSGEGGP